MVEIKKQKSPAIATVVNLGVYFLHLRDTEKIEKPNAEIRPKIRPGKEFSSVLSYAITNMPKVATIIAIHTVIEILSLKNKKASNAVKKGIAAKHNKVIAALVFVIENMKEIIATPRPDPPIKPDKPILK